MAKGKHLGTCQICGAVQVVDIHGDLVKHGYTVKNGWGFVGTCQGSGKLPYEISKNFIPFLMQTISENIEASKNRIEDIKNNKTPAYTSYAVYENHRPVEKVIEITLDNLATIQAFTHLKHDLGFKSLSNEDKIAYLKTRVCLKIHQEIRNMESFNIYLLKRITDWTPKTLSERVLEEKVPLKHLYTGPRAMYVACAGSCMGGMRKQGNSTEDKSMVTCPKCLKIIEKKGN